MIENVGRDKVNTVPKKGHNDQSEAGGRLWRVCKANFPRKWGGRAKLQAEWGMARDASRGAP